ncbi:MAG: ABC transporter permease [Oscillospiraceae bacterium]|jgi:lipopolysaccharide transport system permease protein|nr:ABC transporter permease [Oscillospiraceae bacterium]
MAQTNPSPALRKTVIEAGGRNLQYWKDTWRYRGLAWDMARRNITVRYKQTVIGFGWSIVNPIISTIVMSFVFGNLAGFAGATEINYNVCVLAGTIPWGMFSRCCTNNADVFRAGASLWSKCYFPRLILPLSGLYTTFLDNILTYAILFFFMGITHYVPPVRLLLSVPLLVPIALLGTFIGFVFSSYVIRWRDLGYVLPIILQIGQYLTPVAYSAANIEKAMGGGLTHTLYNIAYTINPMVGYETLFKWTMLDDPVFAFDWWSVGVSVAWTVAFGVFGISRFRKAERTFVDMV